MFAAMLALVTMTRALSALASIPPARIVVPNVDAVAAQIGSVHYTRLPAVCWFGTFESPATNDVQICRNACSAVAVDTLPTLHLLMTLINKHRLPTYLAYRYCTYAHGLQISACCPFKIS